MLGCGGLRNHRCDRRRRLWIVPTDPEAVRLQVCQWLISSWGVFGSLTHIHRPTGGHSQFRLECLVGDTVFRTGDEVGELDRLNAFVDDLCTHVSIGDHTGR
jgi:hypothetical protein